MTQSVEAEYLLQCGQVKIMPAGEMMKLDTNAGSIELSVKGIVDFGRNNGIVCTNDQINVHRAQVPSEIGQGDIGWETSCP